MKKANSVVGVESLGQLGSFQPLSRAAMEYELDQCPAPWKCPDVCYSACVGCLRKQCLR